MTATRSVDDSRVSSSTRFPCFRRSRSPTANVAVSPSSVAGVSEDDPGAAEPSTRPPIAVDGTDPDRGWTPAAACVARPEPLKRTFIDYGPVAREGYRGHGRRRRRHRRLHYRCLWDFRRSVRQQRTYFGERVRDRGKVSVNNSK